MSDSKEKKKGEIPDEALYAVFTLLFGGMLWMKIKPTVIYFLTTYALTIKITAFLIPTCGLLILGVWLYNKYCDSKKNDYVTGKSEQSAFLGNSTKTKKAIYLHENERRTHMQVIGTTSAGKTESLIFPLAISDIERGAGLLIIDGKADHDFLNKLYAYSVKNGREKEFRLFSLAHPEKSWAFNPFIGGDHPQVVERVFSIFTFDNDYYKSIQYQVFSNLVQLVMEAKKVPNFQLIRSLLNDQEQLNDWLPFAKSESLKKDLLSFIAQPKEERIKNTRGLDAQMSIFTTGKLAPLFNSSQSLFTLAESMEKNQIVYFQLPTMLYQQLGQKMGKMVVQCFQSSVADRQVGLNKKDKKKFFACYLDDFQDYIDKGIGSLLNKSRSANVAITFSHQSMGDLNEVSENFANVVFTNTNIKAIMRCNDPDTCDLFSKTFGTKTIEKTTEQKQKKLFGSGKTGSGSAREAEQFNFHPNKIKEMERGHAILSIPHPGGVITQKVNFYMRENLEPIDTPKIFKTLTTIEAPHDPKKPTSIKIKKMI